MTKRPVDYFGVPWSDAALGTFASAGGGKGWENPRAKNPGAPPAPVPPPSGHNWQHVPETKKEQNHA